MIRIGIDVGGTGIQTGIVNEQGAILAEESILNEKDRIDLRKLKPIIIRPCIFQCSGNYYHNRFICLICAPDKSRLPISHLNLRV